MKVVATNTPPGLRTLLISATYRMIYLQSLDYLSIYQNLQYLKVESIYSYQNQNLRSYL